MLVVEVGQAQRLPRKHPSCSSRQPWALRLPVLALGTETAVLNGVPWIHILSGLHLCLALILLRGGLELEQHIHPIGQKPKAISSCQSPSISLPPVPMANGPDWHLSKWNNGF